MPLPERRKSRRALPCRLAACPVIAATRASYSFCWGDCGGGTNSSFETIRDGIGGSRSSAASSSSHWRTHMTDLPVNSRASSEFGRQCGRHAPRRSTSSTTTPVSSRPPREGRREQVVDHGQQQQVIEADDQRQVLAQPA